MPTLSVNGTQLYYQDLGEGPETIVFAHGLLLDSYQYQGQIDTLKNSYRCIAYDHRGQGLSLSEPSPSIDMETLYFDAAALIEQLGTAPCHFVGLSMGGFVGLRLAARRPELLKTLTLLNTSAMAEPQANLPKYKRLNLIARWLGLTPITPRLLPIIFGQTFLNQEKYSSIRTFWQQRIAANARSIYKAVNGVIYRPSLESELQNIQVPTLVIHGQEDKAIPVQVGRELANAISQAEFYSLPEVGHSATIEAPEAVTETLSQFLHKQQSASSTV